MKQHRLERERSKQKHILNGGDSGIDYQKRTQLGSSRSGF
jgi:hypothetical protein